MSQPPYRNQRNPKGSSSSYSRELWTSQGPLPQASPAWASPDLPPSPGVSTSAPIWSPTFYDTSPPSTLSSAGIYSPPLDDWNQFDASFGVAAQWDPLQNSEIDSYGEDPLFSPTNSSSLYDNDWMTNDSQAGNNYPYLTLADIHQDIPLDAKGLPFQSVGGSDLTPTVTLQSPPPRKHARREPKEPQKSSKGAETDRRTRTSTSSSSKSSDRESRHSRKKSNSSPHQLRSTKPTPSSSRTKKTAVLDDHGRTSHNLVEKQYRTRLNGQFEALLSVIPKEAISSDCSEGESTAAAERKLCKAEVLVLARKRIKELEKTHEGLQSEYDTLTDSVEHLTEVWVAMESASLNARN